MIILARKRVKIAIFLLLVSFVLLIVGPLGIKYFLDQSVRRVEVIKDKVVKLNFQPSLIINGHIKNNGKISFKECKITAKVIRSDKNIYKNYLNTLKPLRIKTIDIKENLTIGNKKMFKIIIDDFRYQGDLNVTLSGVCY